MGDYRLMTDIIDRQTASYRHARSEHVTMAEIMLLLVFCLLIAVGVSLATERAKRDDALLRLKQVEAAASVNDKALDAIRKNPNLMVLLERARKLGSQSEIDDFWRKLVNSDDVVTRMEQQGVPLATLKEETDDLARLRKLMREGIDPDKIARSAALAAAIDAMLADKKLGDLTPQEIAALIEKGLTAAAVKPADEADTKK